MPIYAIKVRCLYFHSWPSTGSCKHLSRFGHLALSQSSCVNIKKVSLPEDEDFPSGQMQVGVIQAVTKLGQVVVECAVVEGTQGHQNMVVKAEIMTTALLDRLTHKAHILEFVGESYRFRQRLRQEEQQSGEGKTETG